MKKILFLLLLSVAMYGQVPVDATPLENIQITNNIQDNTATKVTVQDNDGVQNWQFIKDFQNTKPYFSTGLLKNGLLTINTDNTKFDLSAGIGVYSDFSDPENVTSKVFNFPAFSAVVSPYLATSNITYVAVNYNGGSPVLVMQASQFTNTQLRDLVEVGAVIHSNFTTINTINNISSPSNDVGNSVADLFNFLGARNQEGNVYSANGANLQLNKSAGVILKYGANFHLNAKNPHNVFLPEQLSLTFRYRLQGGFEGTDRINVDVDNYDLNNVLTSVPNNKYTIQTIFIPQTGLTRIQYGQTTYNTLADAVAAINTRKFNVETNLATQFVKVAYLVVKKGTTSLQVVADADIIQASKFDATASGGVAITSESVLAALGFVPENVANKQNSLAIDGTGAKYPTVDAVNAALPKNYAKVVYVNSTTPSTATIFDDENPPVVNDDLLKSDVANLYIGTDASPWVWNGSTYETKVVPASSNFYLSGTTVDAGNSKIEPIERSGVIKSGGLVTDGVYANAINVAFETPNTIASFDAGKQLRSLSTDTYPSLTELSYVKGVTSGIQTQINGKADLDGSGKVPLSQINDALLGSVNYKGTYNATTNVPAIPTATSSNKGWYYIISTAGTQQGFNFVNGDWIISNGTSWGKVDNNNTVTSVNGQVGAVSVTASSIGAQTTLANPVTGTGTMGYVSFWNGTNTQTADSNLFWNNTHKRLGIGTVDPLFTLDLYNASSSSVSVRNAYTEGLLFASALGYTGFGTQNNTDMVIRTNALERARIKNNGRFLINNMVDDGVNQLQVTGRVSSGTTTAGNTPPTANNQLTRKDYVDAGLALKANDSDVVHKSGDETITGVKTFTESGFSDNAVVIAPGEIRISNNAIEYPAIIRADNVTGIRDIQMPDASGTIAITDSPKLTGVPEAPTAPVGTNTTQIATTAFVQAAITNNGIITTATNITNATLTDSGLPQSGKTLYISNGATNISYTVNGGTTASFVKGGTGSITFVQGAGRTMVAANGTLVFNGAQYSTASIVSFGTTDIVYINNF